MCTWCAETWLMVACVCVWLWLSTKQHRYECLMFVEVEMASFAMNNMGEEEEKTRDKSEEWFGNVRRQQLFGAAHITFQPSHSRTPPLDLLPSLLLLLRCLACCCHSPVT